MRSDPSTPFRRVASKHGRSPDLIAGIIQDHQEAVEWLFEVVRQERSLTTSFVKELHALMTRKQTHAEGVDMFGRATRIELRQGDYKQRPNNPTRDDEKVHEYCPPEHVAAEMDRLIALQYLYDNGVDATPHGFRSSFRDWASEETDAPNEVCELALAHVNSDRTEAAYRRTDLYERRRGATPPTPGKRVPGGTGASC